MGIRDFFGNHKKPDEEKSASEIKEKGGLFAASVLLSEAKFSFEQFVSDLKADWDITLDSAYSPGELLEFMTDVAAYVIESDVVLRDGETIGFSEEQKLPITKSPSAVLDGETVKIKF